MPDIGVRVIRMLQQGHAPDEIGGALDEDVDVGDFLSTLEELGFLAGEQPDVVEPPAPGWAPRLGRVLFCRMAWWAYALALLGSVMIFVVRPDFLPRPADLFVVDNVLISLVVLTVLGSPLAAIHELSHYLAARALDVRARFSVSRRFYFMVYETDLTELWSLPRRKRYGPQLAGIATDSLVLWLALLGLTITDNRVLALVVFLKVYTMGWQCFAFMRTDLYGVLATALGCRALWRAKTLELRRRFGRLTAAESTEYADLHPRDRQVARWYSLVYLGGVVLAGAYFAGFFVPALIRIVRWTGEGLATGPANGQFWQSCAIVLLSIGPTLVAVTMFFVERVRSARPPLG